jgi:hypothetical protein
MTCRRCSVTCPDRNVRFPPVADIRLSVLVAGPLQSELRPFVVAGYSQIDPGEHEQACMEP